MHKKTSIVLSTLLLTALLTPATLGQDDAFSGGFSYGPPQTDESGDDVENQWIQTSVVFDDPRLYGTVTLTANSDQLEEDGVYRYSFRIENDEGAWQGEPVAGFTFGDGTTATSVHLLVGEGAYEGSVAVAEIGLANTRFSVRGRIVEGPFPEL
mgnify:CR=1 FL=1